MPSSPRVFPNASSRSVRSGLALLTGLWLLPLTLVQGASHRWDDIPAEQQNAQPTKPEVEEAGAEMLMVKRSVKFGDTGLIRTSFFRTKVYAERAAAKVGRIRITLTSRASLAECAARVTRADGTIREFDIEDFPMINVVERGSGGIGMAIYAVDDSTPIKVSGLETHQLQITDLQPGDIVELYHVINENMGAQQGYAATVYENMQEDWPIRTLEFAIIQDDSKIDGYEWNMTWCNMPKVEKTKSWSGMTLVAEDLPAYRAEKDMMPERDVRAFVILTATSGNLRQAFTNWDEFVGWTYGDTDRDCRPNSAMKKLARELVAGAKTTEAKIKKLHDYCQRSITNVTYQVLAEWSQLPAADRQRWTAAKTLEHGYGTARTINCLFVALANAAGLDSTLALTTSSRDMLRADRVTCGWLFMRETAVAVKQGEKWVYYSPGMRWAPFGQSYWQNQGTSVLLAKKGKPHWEMRPVVRDISHDQMHRRGSFTLTEQGVLTGEITETLSGQLSMTWRHQYKNFDEQKLNEVVLKRGKIGYPLAEVSAVRIEDDYDNTHPVVLHYEVSIPDYATRAGDRIVFAPNVLRARMRPRYTDEQPRLNPIRYQFGMVVHDEMELQLPEGYELEAGAAPAAVDFAELAGIKQTTTLRYVPSKAQLLSDSTLAFGLDGKTMFPAKAYRAIKQMFEAVNRAESHKLVLKPKAGYTPQPISVAPTSAPEETEEEFEAEAPPVEDI